MKRRELLMLAKVLKPKKHDVSGWYVSEKLDGTRCFWDGGLSRGKQTATIPWAGVLNPKTGQPKKKIKPVATGLWSRYGNPIMAPDWFLNTLPCCPLDGELWAGRGRFQDTVSFIRKDKPIDSEWKQIRYGIFGTPNFTSFLQDGEIKNSQQLTVIHNAKYWMTTVLDNVDWCSLLEGSPFSAELAHINKWIDDLSETAFMIQQTKLPNNELMAIVEALNKKKEIVDQGGEGIFLRDPTSVWSPHRVDFCLKLKEELDDEGIVVGFTSGRETDKGSKLLGLIGALVLNYNGKRLELSGLTDEEREFATRESVEVATQNPGQEMPEGTQGRVFKTGDKVTFKYREKSNDGIPKDARYFRKRK